MTDALADLTRPQLLDYARRVGLKVTSRSTRDELVEAILARAAHASTGEDVADDAHLGFPGQPGHPGDAEG